MNWLERQHCEEWVMRGGLVLGGMSRMLGNMSQKAVIKTVYSTVALLVWLYLVIL